MVNWIKNLLSKLFSIFKKFIADVFSKASEVVIAEFKDFAIEVVDGLNVEDITNEEKRIKAIEALKAEALSRGKELSTSLTSLLVELAVQYLKNQGSSS